MMEAKDYTSAEMADIHFFYGRANGNAHEARRLYQETFPNRRLPRSRTFSRIAQRLRERGKFIPTIEGGRPRTARTVQQEQRILAHVAAKPRTSTLRYLQRRVFTEIQFGGYYTKIGCNHIICNMYRVLSWRIFLAV